MPERRGSGARDPHVGRQAPVPAEAPVAGAGLAPQGRAGSSVEDGEDEVLLDGRRHGQVPPRPGGRAHELRVPVHPAPIGRVETLQLVVGDRSTLQPQ